MPNECSLFVGCGLFLGDPVLGRVVDNPFGSDLG